MPSRLNRRDRALLLAIAAIVVLLIVITVAIDSSSEQSQLPTTYSATSRGAKAAFLMLRDSGYRVRRWERPPRDLPVDARATYVLAEPAARPSKTDRDALNAFLEHGGRIIATGVQGALFLPHGRALPTPRLAVTWERIPARTPSSITRAANEVSLDPSAQWLGDAPAVVLYADRETRVVQYAVGRGEVIWWASATPLTNAGIREQGNLEFFLACLGDRTRLVFWDEYLHGYRESLAGTVSQSPFRFVMVPAILGLVAIVMTYSRRSGPIVPARVETRLAPLEFVRTLGMLYRRAGAASVAVDVAYQRFRYRLTRRLGIAPTASATELDAAVRAHFDLPADLADVLRECEEARLRARLPPTAALRLTRALADYSARLGLS